MVYFIWNRLLLFGPKIGGGGLGNSAKCDITVCTLQLKNFESCKVNIFQVFLRESEKSLIRGLNKSFEKNRESGVVV